MNEKFLLVVDNLLQLLPELVDVDQGLRLRVGDYREVAALCFHFRTWKNWAKNLDHDEDVMEKQLCSIFPTTIAVGILIDFLKG